jgi:hypothetical protein
VSGIANLNSVRQGLLAMRRRLGRSRAPNGSASTFGRIIGELETLNRSTERDFLAVGDKLMEFRMSARQIASDMATVSGLVAGEQGSSASHALTRMLEYSKEIDVRIEASGRALASVSECSKRLGKAFSGLPNMVAVFRSLCTLTQIETARLGATGADLGHLAAEIRPLSESIQSSGEGVVEASRRLDRAVQSAIRSGSQVRATLLQEMAVLIPGVLGGMQSFEERRRLALESSHRQAAEYAAVGHAIDDLVSSIQFHDITRQQVEHVLEALREIGSHSPDTSAGTHHSPFDLRAVLTLQSSQLAEAARLFGQTIERIDQALENIAGRLHNASESVGELLGGLGQGQESFFSNMEAQFSGILQMLGTCTAAQAEIESTVTGLEENIGGMRASVAEIRGTRDSNPTDFDQRYHPCHPYRSRRHRVEQNCRGDAASGSGVQHQHRGSSRNAGCHERGVPDIVREQGSRRRGQEGFYRQPGGRGTAKCALRIAFLERIERSARRSYFPTRRRAGP